MAGKWKPDADEICHKLSVSSVGASALRGCAIQRDRGRCLSPGYEVHLWRKALGRGIRFLCFFM